MNASVLCYCQEILAPRAKWCEVAEKRGQELESAGAKVESLKKAKEDALKELDKMKASTTLLKENFNKKLEDKSSQLKSVEAGKKAAEKAAAKVNKEKKKLEKDRASLDAEVEV